MKVHIYRLENESGLGPYRTDHDLEDELLVAHSDYKVWPTPDIDGISIHHLFYGWNCGFQSEEHLYKWFDGFIEKLHDVGFHIAKYEVDVKYVAYGKKQVVFDKSQSCLLEVLEPNYI
jgi:hypothetical protein